MAVERQTMPAGLIDHFRREITAGRLNAGDRLPAGREIAEQFNVSLPTARARTTALAGLGLAEIRPRNGGFIRAPPPQPLPSPRPSGLSCCRPRQTFGAPSAALPA